MRSSIIKRLALIASVPATLFVMVALASAPAEAAAAAPASAAVLQADIVAQTNVQRAAHGCRPLVVNAQLTTAAAGQSAFMARSGAFSHMGAAGSSFVTRIQATGYTRALSENIAFGFRSGADVVNAWMTSPEHRANLLNCKAVTVGVGAVYGASGTPYYTQDFGY
jgi:uncharacterized protein YkwD